MESPNRMANKNSGSHDSITGDFWKPSRLVPTPSWKTSTRMPYAAPTDSRFMTTAFRGTTIERKATSSSRKLKPSHEDEYERQVVFLCLHRVDGLRRRPTDEHLCRIAAEGGRDVLAA